MILPDGKHAIVHYMPVPIMASVNGRTYDFSYKNGVALAIVEPGDVDKVMRISKVCCGGRNSPIFREASEPQYQIWMGIYRT